MSVPLLSSTHSSIQQILIEFPSVSGPILEAEGMAAAKNDQTLPAWSVALSREERQTTNKETEMDEINPDNDKCYEENRTSRVTRMALWGGSRWSCRASERTFLWGVAKGIWRGQYPFCSVQFSLYLVATLCTPGLCPVSCHRFGCGPGRDLTPFPPCTPDPIVSLPFTARALS